MDSARLRLTGFKCLVATLQQSKFFSYISFFYLFPFFFHHRSTALTLSCALHRCIAALAFDYTTFGGSEGLHEGERHWIDPNRHTIDYKMAVDFVRSNLNDQVDVRWS